MPRKPKPEPPKSVTLASGAVIPLGAPVSYYLNGWRVGYLEEIIAEQTVSIRPNKVGARHVTLGTDDLKAIS